MTSPIDKSLLHVCIVRCAGLISDVKDIPQLKNIYHQISVLRGTLHRMSKALRPHTLDCSNSDPTQHPGLSLLAVYLFNLRNTCGYFGVNFKTPWRLNGEQRTSALGDINNPFERIAEELSLMSRKLRAILGDKQMDVQEKANDMCEWAESMIEHWNFFRREFGIAVGLAAAASASSGSRQTTQDTSILDNSDDLRNYKMACDHKLERTQVWDDIRDELAAEGIGYDEVAKVADDLKACVRNLVRGQRAGAVPDEPETTSHTVRTSECTAIEELHASRDSSKSFLDREAICSRLTDALDRIETDFDQVATEFLTVALQEDEGESPKSFRQALDVIYFTACRDTTRAKALAKLAKHVQDHVTPRIRELMMSKKWAKIQSESGGKTKGPGPVTSWYLGRCGEAWTTGKNGSKRLSALEFSFGLPRFTGELVQSGVFKEHQVHTYIRSNLDPTVESDQLVAVYQLLRITGRMCEGKHMRAHFENIISLIDNEDTSDSVKALARELNNLRESHWKSKESEVIDEVEAEMRDSI